jgi:peroxiredoxin
VLLAAMEPEIDVAYSKICTISTDPILGCLEWRNSLGAHWPFLSDARRTIQKDLDIQEYTDPHHDPMIPTTFMLEPGLVIYSVYDGYWYWKRPTPEEIRQDFRAIAAKIRPDWDLATPGLREKWDAGERGDFWPYRGR